MAYTSSALAPGDIILVAGHTQGETALARLFDDAIAWATTNPFHHAVLVGDGHLLEVLWRVTRSPLAKYAATGWLFRPLATEAERSRALAWGEARLGQRYGFEELLLDAARSVAHLPLGARFQPRRFTCSGFVAQAYRAAGRPLTYEPLPSPASLSYSPLLVGKRPWELPPTLRLTSQTGARSARTGQENRAARRRGRGTALRQGA